MKYRWVYAVLAITMAAIPNGAGAPAPDWRDDKANIEIVRELNRAYRRVPFSTEYEGVSDNCPIEIDWTVGPDLPLPGKGSLSGLFGDEIVIAAGAWLDNKPRSLAFNFKTGSYREVAPPPMNTSFAQGTFDGKNIYLVGGKSAGRQAAKLGARRRWNPAVDGSASYSGTEPLDGCGQLNRRLAVSVYGAGEGRFRVARRAGGGRQRPAGTAQSACVAPQAQHAQCQVGADGGLPGPSLLRPQHGRRSGKSLCVRRLA